MRAKNLDNYKIKENINYCLSLWKEFVTLTSEEMENYRQLVNFYTGKNTFLLYKERKRTNYKCKKVFCPELQTEYASLMECAIALNSTSHAVQKALKRQTKIRGQYTIKAV